MPATIDLRRAVPATAQVNYAVSGSTRARVEVEGTVISKFFPAGCNLEPGFA